MPIITLSQNDILGKGEAYHFSRSVLAPSRVKALHEQDYYELFWLHNGRAKLITQVDHTEKTQKLGEGDVVFMAPGLPHALQGLGEESHVVNVIVRRKAFNALAARHSELTEIFPSQGQQPHIHHRDMQQLARLSAAARSLETAPRTSLYLDAFLLPLIAELAGEKRADIGAAPAWLSRALAAAEQPAVFRAGASGLVRECGKAHAHVARLMQIHLGQTPSEFINDKRMDHAARQLKGTPDPLLEIAEEIGISNMSHFHRLFRARFGVTPRQYRLTHQKGVIQPV